MGRLLAPRGDSSSGSSSKSSSASKSGSTKKQNSSANNWNEDGNRLIRPGQGSGASSSSGGSKGGGSSSGGASKGGGSSGSGYGGGSSSSGAGRGWNPGDIVTEGGRDYIRSSTGMKVPLDSDAGRRVQSQYANRGGSGGGYNQTTKVLSDYIGPNGGFGGYGQYDPSSAVGMKAADYLNSNYTPGSAYTSDPWAGAAVGRLKNGMMVDRDYLEKHPDTEVYPLTYKATNYKSTVGPDGRLYNHLGQAWGEGGVWTYDELPDYAKAKQDWNFGVSPGYSYPKSDAYNDAYNWYNGTYGVAGDDTHPLSQGQKAGGGTYWAAGGTGVGGPEYRPNQLYYSTPDGSGGYGAATGAGSYTGSYSAKAIPSTGIYGGGGMDYMREYQNALDSAENESARAYRKQIEAAIDAINAQRDPLRQQYEQGAQQAYIEAERAKKQLPEALAAQGINGGATESANLAIETNRGNSLNDLTNTYNNALAGLEQSISQARSSGDMQLAQNASQYQQMLANAILAAQQQQQQYAQQMAMMNYQNQLDMDSYEKQLQLQNKYKPSSGSSGMTVAQRYNAAMANFSLTGDERYLVLANQLAGLPEYAENGGSVSSISPGKAEQLSRWWSANSKGTFYSLINDEMRKGNLTQAEVNAWMRSVGLP